MAESYIKGGGISQQMQMLLKTASH